MDVFVCAGCGTEVTAPVEAAARQGVYAPVYSVSFGPRDKVVIAPGDSRSMSLILDRCEGYCQGVDGRSGPNLACQGCGRAVATRVDDCGSWQTVWLEPDAVVRRPSGLPAGPPSGWDDVRRPEHRVPPVELDGSWSRRWEAAVGVALAHLVAATGDRPVALPPGPVTALLAHPAETSPMPATGLLPEGVLRDDYSPHPWYPLTPHHEAFVATLVRLPDVRTSWLQRSRRPC